MSDTNRNTPTTRRRSAVRKEHEKSLHQRPYGLWLHRVLGGLDDEVIINSQHSRLHISQQRSAPYPAEAHDSKKTPEMVRDQTRLKIYTTLR